jgi:hypothetical protein
VCPTVRRTNISQREYPAWYWTNSIEQILLENVTPTPSSSQEIRVPLWNSNVHYRVQKNSFTSIVVFALYSWGPGFKYPPRGYANWSFL